MKNTEKHLDIEKYPRHIPVLLHETYTYLVQDVAKRGEIKRFYHLDCNFGDAGHVEYFAEQAKDSGYALDIHAVDADQHAIDRGLSFLKVNPKVVTIPVHIHKGNFKDIKALIPEGIRFTSVLFDLGLSTYQLGPSERGFSFKYEEQLDMRFSSDPVLNDSAEEFTAFDIVNYWSAETIALILRNYADESRAWKIVQAIEAERLGGPIQTSKQLAELIVKTLGINKKTGIHPATKTFQALRIAVNKEIEILDKVLDDVLELLEPGGRIGVISYHSLEDMVTKRTFKQWEEDSVGQRITKKVLVPTEEEIQKNPRSRSAKFRVFEKNY